MRSLIPVTLGILMLLTGTSTAHARDGFFKGTLDDDQPSFSTTFDLKRGESVYIAADAISGDLDPYLSLKNPDGIIILENDDRDYDQLNAALGYTAVHAGAYTVTVSRLYPDSGGEYKLKIIVGDVSVLDNLDTEAADLRLSGPTLLFDTAHFRIHYTLQGVDAVTEAYLYQVAKTLESVWQEQVVRQGWPAPPSDGRSGGDARLDVYLMDMLDEEGFGALGAARPGHQFGDNPNTAALEQYASSSLLRLDNDLQELSHAGDPVALMRATAAHEFHHAIQHGYDRYDMPWYAEATAVWMETQTFPRDQDATGYVDYTYRYPDLCFGTESDPDDGLLMYGEWLFIQSLVDAHGEEAIFSLWRHIAQYDGFAALEAALREYGESVPAALARYRLQNVARAYKFAPQFGDATVWLSGAVTGTGRSRGYDVQELGARYLAFRLPKGTYHVSLPDDNSLELWAIGVAGNQVSGIPLGRGGVISNAGYDYVYLMVFNRAFQDDLTACTDTQYTLDVMPVDQVAALSPAYTWDARHFLPLEIGR